MALTIKPSIFREYDIRGIAGRDLSEAFAHALGQTYGEHVKAKLGDTKKLKVSVGRDCRLTGEAYARSLIRGILETGIDVVELGVCPTPLTYFSVFHLDLDGGIMVTGSHNPSDYNGFKICIKKDTIHGHEIQELRARMESLLAVGFKPASQAGILGSFDVIPAYIEHVLKGVKTTRKLKIVCDAGNGVAGNVAPVLLKKMGADVIELFCDLDGRFPNHHPDPTVPANLKAMTETVRKEKADFGVAFDGDADRIGLVDETGKVIFGDEIMVLFSRDVLKENPGAAIISEVKSSHRLYQDIAKNGGRPIMWKTGHSLIKSKMKEERAKLAGEMSGHIFFADRYFGYDDAVYAATRLYEIASHHMGRFSDLLKDLPTSVNTPEIRVDCEEELKFKLVETTKNKLKSQNFDTNDIDGVRVEFGDGWGLLRASNTQPVLVLRFEAPSQARLDEIRSIVETALKTSARELGHPPIQMDGSAH